MNKIDPGEPLDKDIYDLSPEEMKKVPSMPASLDEALDRARRRSRLPAERRRVHRGADRDLHRLQAQERSRSGPPAAASVRVRAVLRHLGVSCRRGLVSFRSQNSQFLIHRNLSASFGVSPLADGLPLRRGSRA